MFRTPHLDGHNTTDPKPEILSAVKTGNRISRDGRNIRGITHVHMQRKDDIFSQRRLNHSEMGEGDYGTPNHIPACGSEFLILEKCNIFILL